MNGSREKRPADDLGVTDESSWLNELVASITHGEAAWTARQREDPGSDVTCEALKLALSTIQLYIAWHAGVISAEVAMDGLDQDIARMITQGAGTTQTGSCEVSSRSSSSETAVTSYALRVNKRNVAQRLAFVKQSWIEPSEPGARKAEMTDDYHKSPEAVAQLDDWQYAVTQEGATEPAFHNEFWDKKQAGIYVDIVSGEPLFASTKKFDSGCGWPTFTAPLEPGSVVAIPDMSLGMIRT